MIAGTCFSNVSLHVDTQGHKHIQHMTHTFPLPLTTDLILEFDCVKLIMPSGSLLSPIHLHLNDMFTSLPAPLVR